MVLVDELVSLITSWFVRNFTQHELGRWVSSQWNRVLRAHDDQWIKKECQFSREEVRYFRKEVHHRFRYVSWDGPFFWIQTLAKEDHVIRSESAGLVWNWKWMINPQVNWHPGHLMFAVARNPNPNSCYCRLNLLELWNLGFSPCEMWELAKGQDLFTKSGATCWSVKQIALTDHLPHCHGENACHLNFRLSLDTLPEHHLEILIALPLDPILPELSISFAAFRWCVVTSVTPTARTRHAFEPWADWYSRTRVKYPFPVKQLTRQTKKFQLCHLDYRKTRSFDQHEFTHGQGDHEHDDFFSFLRYATDLRSWKRVTLCAHWFDENYLPLDKWSPPIYVITPSQSWNLDRVLLLSHHSELGLCLWSVTSKMVIFWQLKSKIKNPTPLNLDSLFDFRVCRHPLDPFRIHLDIPEKIFNPSEFWSGILNLQ